MIVLTGTDLNNFNIWLLSDSHDPTADSNPHLCTMHTSGVSESSWGDIITCDQPTMGRYDGSKIIKSNECVMRKA